MKTSLIKNLSILIFFGFLVKILGLFNKIILSRALLLEGLAYYTKLMPIAALFMTIASFSLGPVITQTVSKNISKIPYSNRNLIKKSFITATTTASIVSVVHLCLNYVICHYLLRSDELIKPFIFFIPLYYLVSYSAIFKGYFHGYDKMEAYAIGQLIEQIVRILLVYIFIIPAINTNLINGVIASILTLSIAELIQNIYLFIRVIFFTKLKGKTTIKTKYIDIIKPASHLTSSKLFSSFSMFLEPIIFTQAFLNTGLSSKIADELYATIYGYSIPIIMTTSFITIAIETAILPSLTVAHNNQEHDKINHLVNKALLLSFIPAAIFSFLYFNFSEELMMLFYKTTKGAYYVKIMAIPSFISYFEGVFVSLLIATKNEKKLVLTTITTNIIHLVLIFILVSIPRINALGIVISFSLLMSITPIILCYIANKKELVDLKVKYLILGIVLYIIFMCTSFFL